jgi:hypothetical protein
VDLLPGGWHLYIRSAARARNDKDRVVLAMAVGRGRNLVGTSREETRSPAHTNAHTIFCPAPATEMLLYYTDTPARLDDGTGPTQRYSTSAITTGGNRRDESAPSTPIDSPESSCPVRGRPNHRRRWKIRLIPSSVRVISTIKRGSLQQPNYQSPSRTIGGTHARASTEP